MKEYEVTFDLTIYIPVAENEKATDAFAKRQKALAKIAKVLEEENIGSSIHYTKSVLRNLEVQDD